MEQIFRFFVKKIYPVSNTLLTIIYILFFLYTERFAPTEN